MRSPHSPGSLALLWDESHLWGAMYLRALESLDTPFFLLRTRDVANGELRRLRPQALIVPGGWASRKARSLGLRGREELRSFVSRGGLYLGFCGGAGLALRGSEPGAGLELCSWSRKPMEQRLPNCSGHMQISRHLPSPYAPGVEQNLQAPVWWPSQFQPQPLLGPRVLATYRGPGEDFWVGDTPLSGLKKTDLNELERAYGINLDPEWLKREPAMIHGNFGQGSYLLTYLHLETPNSPAANRWLARILASAGAEPGQARAVPEWELSVPSCLWRDQGLLYAKRSLEELVTLGEEHFVLGWRKPWLLGWRRGLPGFALNSLLALVCSVLEREPTPEAQKHWRENRKDFLAVLEEFTAGYTELVRAAGRIQALGSPDRAKRPAEEMQTRKKRLVGPFPGQEGVYAELAGMLQELLAKQAP